MEGLKRLYGVVCLDDKISFLLREVDLGGGKYNWQVGMI